MNTPKNPIFTVSGYPMPLVIKLLRPEEWQEFQATGIFAGSADDLRDGYIHLSTPEQAQITAIKWFSGITGLMAISFNTDTLLEPLRWESPRNGELFPHYYSMLKLSDVLNAAPFMPA